MCREIVPVLGSIPVSVSSLQNRHVCLQMNVLADYKHVHLFRHLVARARAKVRPHQIHPATLELPRASAVSACCSVHKYVLNVIYGVVRRGLGVASLICICMNGSAHTL